MSGVADFGGGEVAEAFVEIHADTDALDEEVDRAATKAAKEASKTAPPIRYNAEVPSEKVVAAAKRAARAAQDSVKISYGAEVSSASLRRAARTAAAEARESVSVNFGAKVLLGSLLSAMRKTAAEANGRVSVNFGAKVSGSALSRAIKAAATEAKGIEVSIPVSATGDTKANAAASKGAIDAAKALEDEQRKILRNSQLASNWARKVSAEIRAGTRARKLGLGPILAEAAALDDVGRKAVTAAGRFADFSRNFRIKKPAGSIAGALDIDNAAEALNTLRYVGQNLARFFQGGLLKAIRLPGKALEAVGKAATAAGNGMAKFGEGIAESGEEVAQLSGGVIAKLGEGLAELGAKAAAAGVSLDAATGGIAGLAAAAVALGAIEVLGSTLVWISGIATDIAAVATAVGTGVIGGLGALAGGLTAVGVAAATVGIGFSGVGSALKAYNTAQAAIADGATPTKKQLKAINDALAGLAPNARAAVVAISGFQSQWKTVVQQPVQQALFAGWADSITEIAQKLLPAVGAGLSGIAGTVSDIGNSFADWATKGSTVKQVSDILAGLRPILSDVATFAGEVGEGLINLFQGALPFIDEVIRGAGRAATAFADWTAQVNADGSLDDFLARAKDDLQLLVDIAGNVGDALGALFDPLESSGRGFLSTIDELTARFAAWLNSASGQNTIADFINDGKKAASDLKGVLVLMEPILSTLWKSFRTTFNVLTLLFEGLYPILHAVANGLAAIADAAVVAAKGVALLARPWDLITGNADLSGFTKSLDDLKKRLAETFTWDFLTGPVPVKPGDVNLPPGSGKKVSNDANRQLHEQLDAQPPGKPIAVKPPQLKFTDSAGNPIPAKDTKDAVDAINKAVKERAARLKAAAERAAIQYYRDHPIGSGSDPLVVTPPKIAPPDPKKTGDAINKAIKKGLAASKGQVGSGGDPFSVKPLIGVDPLFKLNADAAAKERKAIKDGLAAGKGKAGAGGDPWLDPSVTLDPKWFVVPQATDDAKAAIHNAIAGGQWPFTHPTVINANWSTPPSTTSRAKQTVEAALRGSAWPYTHSTVINADWSTPHGTGDDAKRVVQVSLNNADWTFTKTAVVNVNYVVKKPKGGAAAAAAAAGGNQTVVAAAAPVSALSATSGGLGAPAPLAPPRAMEFSPSVSRDIGQAVASSVGGLTTGGTTTIEVNLPTGDPEAAAMAVMNRMAGRLAT